MSKKIFLSFALLLGSLTFAQDYYDTYPQNDYNGYEYYDSSYDYPDNYYYNYPADYYPDDYYQGYYSDYRRAVFSVDWNRFFVQYNLSPWQINQIIILNNRFPSFAAWNSYYRWNPDRWYYDRFFALQNILGSNIFVIYQNNYFHGRSPIVFFRNRCVNYYAVHYPVRPVYRNVNINIYRVDRSNFRNGFREPARNNSLVTPRNSNIQNNAPRNGTINNPRNDSNNGGIRNSQNGGFRNNTGITGGIKAENGGSRTLSLPRNNNINNSGRTTENRTNTRQGNPESRNDTNSRASGMRLTLR